MSEQAKPLILVTNDDGTFAPGIKALVEVAREFGEVILVAPNSPQSAKGHAVTLNEPIRYHHIDSFEGIEAYACSGTPVDCVKLAKNVILHGKEIALCLSGINHGSNASVNIIYSGTLSAAMEASLEGVPSIGFSLLDYSFEADFSAAKHYARQLVAFVLEHGIPKGKLLNVNIPKLPLDELRGMKLCRQANGRWVEEFVEGRDPRGEPYFWLSGRFIVDDTGDDTDTEALEQGYVSVVPSSHDLTDYQSLAALKSIGESIFETGNNAWKS